MAKNLHRQKIHLLPCAFLISRHGIFKTHLSPCVFLCVFFLHMFGAFAMRFLLKSVFFNAFGTCVSPRRIFFTPWAPASCAGVFILRVWKSDLHVYCGCIFLPAHCAFFLESAFLDCTCGNKNHIFAASVFWQHMFS